MKQTLGDRRKENVTEMCCRISELIERLPWRDQHRDAAADRDGCHRFKGRAIFVSDPFIGCFAHAQRKLNGRPIACY